MLYKIQYDWIKNRTKRDKPNKQNKVHSNWDTKSLLWMNMAWNNHMFLISLTKLSKLKLHKNLKCVLWDKPVNHRLTWDASCIPNVVKHSTSFYYKAVRYIKFNQNSHFTFLMNKIRSLSHEIAFHSFTDIRAS